MSIAKVIVCGSKQQASVAKAWLVNQQRNYTVDPIYPMQCSEVAWDASTANGGTASAFDYDNEVWIVIGIK